MKQRPLTIKQRDVFQFIMDYKSNNGFMPSTRDIQEAFSHKSQTAAQHYLKVLRVKGFLSESVGKARAYTILKEL